MKAAVDAITAGKGALDVKLTQLVRVMRNGELVRMSKRAGPSSPWPTSWRRLGATVRWP